MHNKPKTKSRFGSDRSSSSSAKGSGQGRDQFRKGGNGNFRKSNNRGNRHRGGFSLDLTKYINNPGGEVAAPVAYAPKHSFSDFLLNDTVKSQVAKRGYVTPTEIQDKAIPAGIEGKDVVGIASTGTGKTAAFLIPILQQLIETPQDQYALVMAPTRELASQIANEFWKLTKGLGIYHTALIGGVPVGESIKALRRKNHLIIGTPGRVKDMADRGLLRLENFQVLVLDEFDRMLDMGFLDDIKELHDQMTSIQQTLLFSATVDPTQQRVMNQMVPNAVRLTAGEKGNRADRIQQDVVRVPRGQKKLEILQEVLEAEVGQKVILFCETKREVDQVNSFLKEVNIAADMIHGDKTQRARESALRKFRTGKIHVLVATDVVARGIDVDDVGLVINYDVPKVYSDYIHRIGRTGRAGKSGKALTLIPQ